MSVQVSQLSVSYGSHKILTNVSMEIESGEVVAVLGANGAGKSTLLSAIAGELAIESGAISIDGHNIAELSAQAQALVRAVLPQTPGLSFSFSVAEVVAMGAYPFAQASPAVVQQWVTEGLSCADLLALSTRAYPELSGGEQQRVQFARVLVQCQAICATNGHAYLLLDEPLSNLDPRHQQQLLQILRRLAQTQKLGVLVILHDVNLAADCDRIVLMARHTVIAQGRPAQVLTQANLRAVFELEMIVLPHPLNAGKLLVLPETKHHLY